MNNIPFRLIRSRRRTLSLTVSGGRVTVKAPYGMPDDIILKFINDKTRWIQTKIEEQNSSAALFSSVKSGACLLDAGKERPVRYGAPKNTEDGNGFRLKNADAVRRYFEKSRGWILYESLYAFSRKMRVAPADVALCDFKARWGSCDADGRIKLNWRLTMLPPELRDYIIVHELSHLRELNHSAQFWAAVGEYCPGYRVYRKRLRDFSFLTQLYRKS